MKKILSLMLGMTVLSASAEILPISTQTCAEMQSANVITEDNPVKCDRLNTVKFNYINFQGEVKQGQVVVLDVVAPQVDLIFQELYAKKFPIAKAEPLEKYHGDDNASMRDNNTSAFNGRPITGGSGWSKHAYGAAIDINPVQNPYLSFPETGVINVNPAQSFKEFVNRLEERPGKDNRQGLSEAVRDIFFSHGFLRWGGNWNYPIDYQHFEVGSFDYINELLSKPLFAAQAEFANYGKAYSDCVAQSQDQDKEHTTKVCVDKILK